MYTRGFTILELIIYIALTSALITGVVVTSYQLVESSTHTGGSATVQEEGSFVLRKLAWAMQGMTAVPSISGSGCNQSISITRSGSINPIQFQRNSTNNSIEMREGGGTYAAITTDNVSVSCLQFAAISGTPGGVVATTTIHGIPFSITKYARK